MSSGSQPENEAEVASSSANPSDPLESQDIQIALLKRNTFTLELPVLLLFFSYNLTSTVFQNEILFQTCMIFEENNSSQCRNITDNIPDDPIVTKIDAYASNIFMARAILENIVPAFISFFIGPWSDLYGRKPILLSTFFGESSPFSYRQSRLTLACLFPFRICSYLFVDRSDLVVIDDMEREPLVLFVRLHPDIGVGRHLRPHHRDILLHHGYFDQRRQSVPVRIA